MIARPPTNTPPTTPPPSLVFNSPDCWARESVNTVKKHNSTVRSLSSRQLPSVHTIITRSPPLSCQGQMCENMLLTMRTIYRVRGRASRIMTRIFRHWWAFGTQLAVTLSRSNIGAIVCLLSCAKKQSWRQAEKKHCTVCLGCVCGWLFRSTIEYHPRSVLAG